MSDLNCVDGCHGSSNRGWILLKNGDSVRGISDGQGGDLVDDDGLPDGNGGTFCSTMDIFSDRTRLEIRVKPHS